MFDDCTFDITKVEGGNWSFVGLPGADLHSATFTGVRLREADLTGVRAAGGTLRDCDLAGAWLHLADLSGCDLRGSDLAGIDPATVNARPRDHHAAAGRRDRRGDGAGPAAGLIGQRPAGAVDVLHTMEPPIGFEPMTPCLQDRCSGRLS